MRSLKRRAGRRLIFTFALLIVFFLVSACAGTRGSRDAAERDGLILTVDELARYDGLEGRKAYIAVDGIVYDVTDIRQWEGGLHQGRFQAGKDYSEEIRTESPHGTGMLARAVKVGILLDE